MPTAHIESELQKLTAAYTEVCKGLTASQLNWKPNAATWSLAQIVDHIIKVNETYYPVVEQLRAGTYQVPFIGRFSLATNFFGNLIFGSVEPQRKRKIKTFPIWEPQTSDIRPDILEVFAKHQADFARFVRGCDDLVASGVVISSPANRVIVYRLEKAFEIIVAHEWRHLEQAKEVRALIG